MSIFDITNQCNMCCDYCNQSVRDQEKQPVEEPPAQAILEIAVQLQAMGVEHLSLQGGEPMLRNDLCRLIRMLGTLKTGRAMDVKREWTDLISRGYSSKRFMIASYFVLRKLEFPIYSIMTNGTIYSCEIENAVYEGGFHLEISLDTANASLHSQKRCSMVFTHEDIVGNMIKYSKRLPVIMQATIYGDNVNEMQSLVSYSHSLGAIHLVMNPLRPLGRAREMDTNWFNEFAQQTLWIMREAVVSPPPVIVEITLPVSYLCGNKPMLTEIRTLQEQVRNMIVHLHQCAAYEDIGDIHITSGLEVYNCQQFLFNPSYSLGNLYYNTIQTLWNKESRERIRQSLETEKEGSHAYNKYNTK